MTSFLLPAGAAPLTVPSIPIRIYDSVDWKAIPADARMVAGYVDGEFAWPAEAWNRFPGAVKLLITAIPGSPAALVANVADIENGDYTPQQAAEWIDAKHAAGMAGATIYCNRNTWPAAISACRGRAYWPWIADWTGEPHQLPGAVAVQYADPATSGGDYDLSVGWSQAWLDLIDAVNRPWPL